MEHQIPIPGSADTATAVLDEFEIDDEMREIFRVEAEELLKSISSNLALLAGDPRNNEALWEIRRNAHTFKGAAGIVGHRKASELAHRVEDLLDKVAEKTASADARLLELLERSALIMQSLVDRPVDAELEAAIQAVYTDIDGAAAFLTVPTEPPPAPPAAAHRVEAPTPTPVKKSKAVARVALGRVDDLAEIVQKLAVSRSTFDERLRELERLSDTLRVCVRRLRGVNAAIETELENGVPSPAASVEKNNYAGAFDALEFDRYTEVQKAARELADSLGELGSASSSLITVRDGLESVYELQRRLIDDTRQKVRHVRQIAFGTLSPRLVRTVKVTCDEEGKLAELIVENGDLELDTETLDSLAEPLLHLLKNAVVHGLEAPEERRMLGKPECGTITLRMENTETHHILSVSDDGRGISHARIRERAAESGLFDPAAAERLTDEQLTDLIFARGMSTAQQLNMNAGRGLGMSIVKESVESRAGDMSVRSGPQAGTIITVRIPLPPAPSPIMFLHAADQLFGIPLKFVRHVTEVAAPVLEKSRAASSIQLGSEKYPLCDLNERLNLPRKAGHAPLTVLLIESHGRSFALSVDRISRTEEIMVQPLGRLLDGLDSVCGAALLANGRVAPVLDIEFIGPGHGLAGDAAGKIDPGPALPRVAANLTVLIVDDSLSVRHTTSRVIQSAGWIAVTAKDGVDAIEILRRTADLPAVILSDIEMPRMDGYQFTAALKADDRFKDIPVVMITSRGSEKHRKTAFDLGVSEYMTKPFDDAQLLGTVRELAA